MALPGQYCRSRPEAFLEKSFLSCPLTWSIVMCVGGLSAMGMGWFLEVEVKLM